MIKLTVAMPSNRDILKSAPSIESALTYVSLRSDANFCLHDNSGDQNKAEKYGALKSSSFHYVNADGFEFRKNWLGAINSCNGKYVTMLGDDDHLFSVGLPLAYEIHEGVAGYIPNFLLRNGGDGIIGTRNFGITGSTASERIKECFNGANGSNVAICSAYKRKLLCDVWPLAWDNHPIKSVYWDWAVTLALVSSGKLYQDKSSIYLYDTENWKTQEKIDTQIVKLFNDADVSDRSRLFILLLLAIDSFILISRVTSPVDREEIIQAAQFSFARYCSSFIDSFKKNKSVFLPREVTAIEKLDANSGGFQGLLNWALHVVESFEPKIIDQYKNFYFISVGKQWGFF